MDSPGSIHNHALQAEKHLEQLATGLGSAGVDPAVVKAVAQMADAMRKIVEQMGPDQMDKAKAATERPATMDGATDSLVDDVRARRSQEGM